MEKEGVNLLKVGKRKIQKIRTAQYICLPKVWTENNHTKKGDVLVFQIESDGSLNVRPEGKNANS